MCITLYDHVFKVAWLPPIVVGLPWHTEHQQLQRSKLTNINDVRVGSTTGLKDSESGPRSCADGQFIHIAVRSFQTQ